jgi:hypothetical protein
MRKEARLLNDIADATAEMDGIGVSGGAAFDKNLPLRRHKHAINKL